MSLCKTHSFLRPDFVLSFLAPFLQCDFYRCPMTLLKDWRKVLSEYGPLCCPIFTLFCRSRGTLPGPSSKSSLSRTEVFWNRAVHLKVLRDTPEPGAVVSFKFIISRGELSWSLHFSKNSGEKPSMPSQESALLTFVNVFGMPSYRPTAKAVLSLPPWRRP